MEILSKMIVSAEWHPRSGGWERAGGVGVCLGSDCSVTPEEFGYSSKQSAQCSHSSRHISGLCSLSESSPSGKRWVSVPVFTPGCWAGTGNVGLTGAPSMLEAEICPWECLWGTPKSPTSLEAAGPVLVLLGPSCPVTEQGTHVGQLLPSSSPALWVTEPSGSPALGSQDGFFLAGISLGRFFIFNKPTFKIIFS